MKPIYLDHAATTPLRAEVRAAMDAVHDGAFGNPSSLHRWGREASSALEEARATCAAALGARSSEIYFVRGGTESDNLAILGRAGFLRADGQLPTVVVTAVDHSAVLAAADAATARGAGRRVTLSVSPDGSVDLDALDRALASGPAVVSMIWVNNETGMVLPVEEVAARVAASGGTFHTDAVQAAGKVPVGVQRLPVDLLTVTGHKIYGPKGTGLLYVRSGTALRPLLHGGGQESTLRPGTQDVAGAAGMATALRLALEEQAVEARRLQTLRDALEARLTASLEGIRVNAGEAPRAPHVASVAIPDVDGQALLMALDLEGIAASGGSACSSGATKASHVIAALYGDDDPFATVRFSLGRSTAEDDVDRAARVVAEAVGRLRAGGATA
ncbi:MAG: cysteine desulfurase family protein [Gemmatimonadota bacterium]